MSDTARTVGDFMAMWERPGGFAASVERYFTDATVYENIGMSKTTGIAEACDMFALFGPVTMTVEVLHQLVQGDLLLNERIDRIHADDGSVRQEIRVMGAFRVHDGRIVEWRDYFDTAPFLARGGG